MYSGRTILILLLMLTPVGFACSDDAASNSDTGQGVDSDTGNPADTDGDATSQNDIKSNTDANESDADATESDARESDDAETPPSFALSLNEAAISDGGADLVWVDSTLVTAYSERCTTKCIESWNVSAGSASSIDDGKLADLGEYSLSLHAMDRGPLLLGTNYKTYKIDISDGVDFGESESGDGERQDYADLYDGRFVSAQTNFGVKLFDRDFYVDDTLNLQDDIRAITNLSDTTVLAGGFRTGTLYEVTIAGNSLVENDSWSVDGDYLWGLDRLSDGTILAAAGSAGLGVFDSSATNLAYLNVGSEVFDIAVLDTDHVLLASDVGVQLVDLSDRSNPVVLDEIAVTEGVWKVSANDEGDFAIVENSGEGNVYIGRYR